MKKQTATRGAGIGLLLVLITAILLIASGLLDPKPVGSWQWEQNLTAERGTQTIPAGEALVFPLATESLPEQFSLRLTAVWQTGEIDSGYGLVLFNDNNSFVVAVAPTGYVSIFNAQFAINNEQIMPHSPFSILNSQFTLPWQTWPHIKPGTGTNEIWLDVTPEKTRVWVNREILWEGEMGMQSEQIGLYGVSFGETAVVAFETLRFYATEPENN